MTPQPLAYRNGHYIPAEKLVVPVEDAGFVQGVTVAEQMRTFNGRLFRVREHLRRLAHSLEIVGVELPMELGELADAAEKLAAHNHQLLAPGDDLGLSLFVTPGAYSAFLPHDALASARRPLVGMHTYPLPFYLWWQNYERGQALVVTGVRQVPTHCWPAELKCRSRMHYYLADREAHRRQAGARALLLDEEGFVTEASTANLVVYRRDQGLLAPPPEKILPGISIATLHDLAAKLEIPFHHVELTVEAVAGADEAMLCSTSPCLWPVVQLDGRSIGDGRPGDVFRRCLDAWSELAGLDIEGQAHHFARRD